MSEDAIDDRLESARQIVDAAAQLALDHFRDRDSLAVEVKGLQDWVSNADRTVELQIRAELAAAWPNDAIRGEEHADVVGSSGFTWVIDPIDGTTNFVSGTPGWCVVLACVHGDSTVCSVIRDPVSDETYSARRGKGAWLNGQRLQVHSAKLLSDGTLGVGHNTRVAPQATLSLLTGLLEQGGLFRRGGSGALDLAYVAAGRLIGYVEPHMNAWDCLASLLFIEEAGGFVQPYDMQAMLARGGQVVAVCPGVSDQVSTLVASSYQNATLEGE